MTTNTDIQVLILSCSLNPSSKSALMAREIEAAFKTLSVKTDFLDLREGDLPFCDGSSCYDDARVKALKRRMDNAQAYVIAAPVYNYYLNAAAKNLIELSGVSMKGKAVGFVLAGGSLISYMSSMNFANSLMLDFRCVVVPRFVYALEKSFEGEKVSDVELKKRLTGLAEEILKLSPNLNC